MNIMIQKKKQKKELGFKFRPINLKIKGYDYNKLYNETSDEDRDDCGEEVYVDLSDMPLLESDEVEVKEGERF